MPDAPLQHLLPPFVCPVTVHGPAALLVARRASTLSRHMHTITWRVKGMRRTACLHPIPSHAASGLVQVGAPSYRTTHRPKLAWACPPPSPPRWVTNTTCMNRGQHASVGECAMSNLMQQHRLIGGAMSVKQTVAHNRDGPKVLPGNDRAMSGTDLPMQLPHASGQTKDGPRPQRQKPGCHTHPCCWQKVTSD